MYQKKFVLMNHTDMLGHHFGCARVMRLIETGITSRGGVIIGRLDGKQDWRKSSAALSMLEDADALFINGEGTLHHGRKKASWLMETAIHPVTRNKELALVNALYQNNPDSWAGMLKKFTHLYARDSWSARAMTAHAGRPVESFGDLSMSAGAMQGSSTRQWLHIGDSTYSHVTQQLESLAKVAAVNHNVKLVPLTVSLREENPYRPWLMRLIRRKSVEMRQKRQEKNNPLLEYLPSESAFLEMLSQSRLSVTGRFHGICLCLVTKTPFIALSSNSWKIEALFDDCKLDSRRLMKPEHLDMNAITKHDWSFSAQEQANIDAFLHNNVQASSRMFDAIVSHAA